MSPVPNLTPDAMLVASIGTFCILWGAQIANALLISRRKKNHPQCDGTAPPCPSCGADMKRLHTVVESDAVKQIWNCAKFPACGGTAESLHPIEEPRQEPTIATT